MIETLIARFGIQAGLKLSRGVVIALVIGALYAAGGLGFWRGMKTIAQMVAASAEAGKAERDAHWRAEIEQSNAAVAREEARREAAAANASARAENEITGLRAALADLEKRNETMPGGARACLDARDLDDLNRLRRRP